MKKIPLRKCLATNTMHPKEDLLRICKAKDGSIFYDPTDKAPGRGAYILKDKDAIKLAQKKKVLDKAFECKVDTSLYEELLSKIK